MALNSAFEFVADVKSHIRDLQLVSTADSVFVQSAGGLASGHYCWHRELCRSEREGDISVALKMILWGPLGHRYLVAVY